MLSIRDGSERADCPCASGSCSSPLSSSNEGAGEGGQESEEATSSSVTTASEVIGHTGPVGVEEATSSGKTPATGVSLAFFLF